MYRNKVNTSSYYYYFYGKIPINFNNLIDFLLWIYITLGSS
ncbi:hypothetical protein BMETH_2277_1 [methanotrophic bacterial endosymbiont of Bathymodiolus sp.]|nr:hypothetical protein BMETH_2277_1 [methanotrophic bacterial endosymbiont of Bathymodiolus sp.]